MRIPTPANNFYCALPTELIPAYLGGNVGFEPTTPGAQRNEVTDITAS